VRGQFRNLIRFFSKLRVSPRFTPVPWRIYSGISKKWSALHFAETTTTTNTERSEEGGSGVSPDYGNSTRTHAEEGPAPRGANGVRVSTSPTFRGANGARVSTSPAPRGENGARVSTSPAPCGANGARVTTNPAPRGANGVRFSTSPAPRGANGAKASSDLIPYNLKKNGAGFNFSNITGSKHPRKS
jgi:hypothetical protein